MFPPLAANRTSPHTWTLWNGSFILAAVSRNLQQPFLSVHYLLCQELNLNTSEFNVVALLPIKKFPVVRIDKLQALEGGNRGRLKL
jgi:hypothetical protein